MNRIGADPGLGGAIALLDDSLKLIDVWDMPTMLKTKSRRQVNDVELAKIIRRWLTEFQPFTAYIEDVHAMPKQGTASVFSFGDSFGVLRACFGALQIPVVLVTPQAWKRRAGLIGKDKDYARTIAQRLYPAADLARKKDIGRAEAILIARFGL
jgi:crossover junction endodeoxyribonuclease RuvC